MTLARMYRYLGFVTAVAVTFLMLRACASVTVQPETPPAPPRLEQPAPLPPERLHRPPSVGEELGRASRELYETAKEEVEGFRRGFKQGE